MRRIGALFDARGELLPGQRLAEVEEAAGGAVARQSGQSSAGFGSLAQLHGGVRAAHFGFDPAGMRGVDLDFGVAQLSAVLEAS